MIKLTTDLNRMGCGMEEKKGCMNCLYCGTHEKCGTGTSDCLGNTKDVEDNRGEYLYRNWEAGNGLARLREFETEGKRNIVIGGMGEAEVNTKWTPEETFEKLCYVSECCGYLTQKGKWTPKHKEIIIYTDRTWKITYIDDVYIGIGKN